LDTDLKTIRFDKAQCGVEVLLRVGAGDEIKEAYIGLTEGQRKQQQIVIGQRLPAGRYKVGLSSYFHHY
jgi:hypothetical protein